MLVLKTEKQAELTVKKSRFIAIARRCTSIQEVKTLVEETRRLHPAATHVVHAAVVGNQFSFSDDREPKNTAGRPAFEVLKGSGISNICILVVRYFGGILLGTGGLVKAYSDSVKLVLESIETEELIEKIPFSLTLDYSTYENAKRMLLSAGAEISNEDFAAAITITGSIPLAQKEPLQTALRNMSNGRYSLDSLASASIDPQFNNV